VNAAIFNEKDNRRQLPSSSSDCTIVNNMVSQPQDKEQRRLDIATALMPEELTMNQLVEGAAGPANLPAPGLVEKLMQQLNDLKEMVYIYIHKL